MSQWIRHVESLTKHLDEGPQLSHRHVGIAAIGLQETGFDELSPGDISVTATGLSRMIGW